MDYVVFELIGLKIIEDKNYSCKFLVCRLVIFK